MRNALRLIAVCAVFGSLAWSQNERISIPAGTPEDKDLAAITAQSDPQKRIAAYEDFLKKYADNKPAAAYAEWQLAEQYLAAGDTAKAAGYGDKALEAYPNNLDILMTQVSIAQATKDNTRVVELSAKGAGVYTSVANQPKPADIPDAEWTTRVSAEQKGLQPSYDFLEAAAYNAMAAEQDPNKRMADIEKFTPAFPKSKFESQVTQLALYTLQQLNQPARLAAYGEKTLAATPDSIPTLLMLASSYAADPKQAGKATTYANKVITLVGPNPDDQTKKSYSGLAHTSLGRVDLEQEKLPSAVTELKTAAGLLEGDPQDQQAALFYLGYAYAKQNQKANAVTALEKAATISGPYQGPARDMLAKVNAAGAPKKK